LGPSRGPSLRRALIIVWLNDELAGFGEWALITQGNILLVVIISFRCGFVDELSALAAVPRPARLRDRRRVSQGLISIGSSNGSGIWSDFTARRSTAR